MYTWTAREKEPSSSGMLIAAVIVIIVAAAGIVSLIANGSWTIFLAKCGFPAIMGGLWFVIGNSGYRQSFTYTMDGKGVTIPYVRFQYRLLPFTEMRRVEIREDRVIVMSGASICMVYVEAAEMAYVSG